MPAGLNLPAGLGPMPASTAAHVDAVVLFGTPDNWFLNLVDRSAPPITVGQQYSAKTLQLCAAGDPVCFPGGLDRGAHSSYKTTAWPIRLPTSQWPIWPPRRPPRSELLNHIDEIFCDFGLSDS